MHAFIVGGTGQIGRAVASGLLAAGWAVTLGHRGHAAVPAGLAGARVAAFDRGEAGALARALGGGADAVIDTVAYDGAHARQLLEVQGSVGHLVVVSSASVYRDAAGRTLDEAAQTGFPELPDPIPETHPTVAPGPATYSTRKVALEQALLAGATVPVTLLRACAIHGVGSRHPREWWFVKRMLDRRAAIPMAYRGESRFHTAAAANIAALVGAVLRNPATRVLNIADPAAPSVAEIGRLIARHMGYGGRLVQVATPEFPPTIGRSPWSVPRPFVVDCAAALATGYVPATDYAGAVGAVCDWLVAGAGEDWRARFPVLAGYPREQFDYAAEDAFFGG